MDEDLAVIRRKIPCPCGIPKPQMRGLGLKHAKVGLGWGLAFAVTTALSYKIFVANRRKRRYAQYYRDFDPQEAVEMMCEAGVLSTGKLCKKGCCW